MNLEKSSSNNEESPKDLGETIKIATEQLKQEKNKEDNKNLGEIARQTAKEFREKNKEGEEGGSKENTDTKQLEQDNQEENKLTQMTDIESMIKDGPGKSENTKEDEIIEAENTINFPENTDITEVEDMNPEILTMEEEHVEDKIIDIGKEIERLEQENAPKETKIEKKETNKTTEVGEVVGEKEIKENEGILSKVKECFLKKGIENQEAKDKLSETKKETLKALLTNKKMIILIGAVLVGASIAWPVLGGSIGVAHLCGLSFGGFIEAGSALAIAQQSATAAIGGGAMLGPDKIKDCFKQFAKKAKVEEKKIETEEDRGKETEPKEEASTKKTAPKEKATKGKEEVNKVVEKEDFTLAKTGESMAKEFIKALTIPQERDKYAENLIKAFKEENLSEEYINQFLEIVKLSKEKASEEIQKIIEKVEKGLGKEDAQEKPTEKKE